MHSNNLADEAAAFDKRIRERVAHGHIPDLRRMTPCDWFYNNPWRRSYMADMICGRMVRYALGHLPDQKCRIFEIGCGTGFIALELARNGHDVTGIDVSSASIEIARQWALENPFKETFGRLTYEVGDFLADIVTGREKYDAICCFQTLHHFHNVAAVLDKTASLLAPDGIFIVNEPSRDTVTDADATIVTILKLLLSACHAWHESLPLPHDDAAMARMVAASRKEYMEARDATEDVQSANDNASHSQEILIQLRKKFTELDYEPDYAFLPRLVGGLRAQTEQEVETLACLAKVCDDFLVHRSFVKPGGFFWAGRR